MTSQYEGIVMDSKSQQQEVYDALLGTANKTSEATVEILKQIQKMLSDVLNHAYADNKELKDELQKTTVLNPDLAKELDSNLSPLVENMQKIHNKVTKMNDEMIAMQAKVTLLNQKDQAASPELQKAIADELSKELKHLNEANQTYTKGLEALRQSVMTLGQQDLAAKITDPKEIKTFDKALNEIYAEARKLKDQATNKKEAVNQVEVKVDETSQKRFGK